MSRIRMIGGLLSTVLVVAGLMVPSATGSPSSGGAELWARRYDGRSYDLAGAVVVSPNGSRVFVTGASRGATTRDDYATVAYDAETGSVEWARRYDGPDHRFDDPYSLAVSPDSSKIFVTGFTTRGTIADYMTIAYGASDGSVVWASGFNSQYNGSDTATSVVASTDGTKVFVTGYSSGSGPEPFNEDYVTVAYDASTGATLWTRRYDGTGAGRDLATAVAASPDGSMVFVTGSSQDATAHDDYATVAYDASNGRTLWVERYDGSGSSDHPNALVASSDGSSVFVTGYSSGANSYDDYATIAYDAATGDARWVRRYNGPGNAYDYANAVASSPDGSTVFITGQSPGGPTKFDYATLAYDAVTGDVLWVRRYNGPGNATDYGDSLAVTPDGSRIVVTGSSGPADNTQDYATIAYDARTGATVWIRRYVGPAGGDDDATSIAVGGSTVFVTGRSKGTENLDYVTVAYVDE